MSKDFNTINICICVIILILNALEIYMLLKKYKEMTRFEAILLNLAIADTIVAAVYLPVGCYGLYYIQQEKLKVTLDEKDLITINRATIKGAIFGLLTSGLFVILIGIERLQAVRKPIIHRARNLSRSSITKYIVAIWLTSILVTGGILIHESFFMHKVRYDFVGSKTSALVVGSVLVSFMLIIIAVYTGIGYSVLTRLSAFRNRGSTTRDMQKEKATIIACLLVMVTYMVCNIPCAVQLLKCESEVKLVEALLLLSSSLCNPLIYFFKGYIESYLKKRGGDNNTNKNNSVANRAESRRQKSKDLQSLEMQSHVNLAIDE